MMLVDKKLVIVYGSQTGNAQDLAERIWRQAKHFNLQGVTLSSANNVDLNRLLDEKTLLVCVCSTTGQGDVPDNMMTFWRALMRKQLNSPTFLSSLLFSVIGLGDSSYDKYNFVAKKIYRRLLQLGATSVVDLCLCDEQNSHGVEGTYSTWSQNFWSLFGLDQKQYKYNASLSKYKIISSSKEQREESLENDVANETRPYYARLVGNTRVTAQDHFQDTRLIEIDCSNTTLLKYDAGDVLGIRPSNLEHNVNKFMEVFEHLKLDLNQSISIDSNFPDEINAEIETRLVKTVGDLIRSYLDINSVPRMSFFEIFAHLADDELESEKLMEFLQGENVEDLYNYCYRPRRSILEVFYDFPKTSKRVASLNTLLDLIPSIKPRYFSIASSPNVHKDRIQLLVAVVEYKTRLFETRKGTCSYWLSQLDPQVETKLPVWIKKGSFQVDYTKPLICIGPGTGVAPFRSILYERINHRQFVSDNFLYFGCRSESKDFYFRDEWGKLSESGSLNLLTAFSRDQADKVYVQDLLIKNSTQMYEMIVNRQATILIAGSSNRMPQDVLANLEKLLSEHLGVEEAKEAIKSMELKRRIQLETWS